MRRFQPWLAPLVYLVVGGIWITFSDQLVELMTRDAGELTKLQTTKGWAFVVLTCAMAFVLVRHAMRESDRIVEAEGQIEAILDTPLIYLALLDPDGHILQLNATAQAAAGASASDQMGRLLWDGIWFRHDASVRAATREAVARAASGERPPPLRVTFVDANLDIRNGEIAFSPAIRPGGQVKWIVVAGRDITEEVASRAALAESENRFRTIANNAPLMLWLGDRHGARTYFNERWYNFTGRTEQEELGSGWLQCVHPEDTGSLQGLFAKATSERAPVSSEFRLKRKDGVWRWVLCHAEPLFDANGDFKGHVGSAIDITESRELSEAAKADAARQRLMLDLTRQILESPTTDASLTEQLFLSIKTSFDLDFCLYYAADHAARELLLLTSLGFSAIDSPPPRTLPLQNTDDVFLPLRWIAAANQIKYALEALGGELTRAIGPHGCIAHPLQASDGTVLGVIAFGSRKHKTFTDAETAFFQTLSYFMGIAWERDRTARALSESERRFRRAIASAPFPILIHAEDGEILLANDTWLRLSGYTRMELTTVSEWIRLAYGEEYRDKVIQDVSRLYEITSAVSEGEYVVRCADGSERIWEFSTAPLGRTQDGRRMVISAAVDVTARRETEAKVTYLAQHDALTNIPNRMLAQDRLAQAIGQAQRADRQVALMFLDIDNFKTINDTLGHGAGDQVLQTMAERLQSVVRDTDTVGRQGGDEFLLILHDVHSLDAVARIAQKLIEEICRPINIDGAMLEVTGSVGIAVFPNDAETLDDLVRKADMAMYQAKESGRNNYRFYAEWMNASTTLQMSIRNDIAVALEQGEFSLEYQPVLALPAFVPIGAEALLRWHSPTRGETFPDIFISVAEEAGFMERIGAWVLRQACLAAAGWQQPGVRLTIGVNVSGMQFRRANFADTVQQALEESGLDPSLLELELTEAALTKYSDTTAKTARRIHQLGVRLTIDDFGTGDTSVSTLKRFDVDSVKIDRSLIKDLGSDRESKALVKTVIHMADAYNATSIAEGVETKEALDALLPLGCHAAQGFYFTPAIPATALEAYFRAHAKPDAHSSPEG